MCDLCNDPDLTIDTHLDRMHQRLTGERFVMLPVAGSRTEPELSDTIGLTAHGPPELVLVGVLPAEVIRLIRVHGDHRLTEAHSCRDAHVRPVHHGGR